MGNCDRCICKICNKHNGMWCNVNTSKFMKYHCQHCNDTGKAIKESVYKCDEFQSKSDEETRMFAEKNNISWLLDRKNKTY